MSFLFRNSYRVLVRRDGKEINPEYRAHRIREGKLPNIGDVIGFIEKYCEGHIHYYCPVIERRESFFRRSAVVIDFELRKEIRWKSGLHKKSGLDGI